MRYAEDVKWGSCAADGYGAAAAADMGYGAAAAADMEWGAGGNGARADAGEENKLWDKGAAWAC